MATKSKAPISAPGQADDKKKALETAIAQIEKNYGKGAIMYLYNSASRKKEKFVPNHPDIVKMYTCGPTVYHFAHIGNLRSYIMAADLGDVLIRERNLVAAVARADQVRQILAALQTRLGADLFHRRNRAQLGIDLGTDGGIGNYFAGLIQNYCLGVGGSYVAAAKVFHL